MADIRRRGFRSVEAAMVVEAVEGIMAGIQSPVQAHSAKKKP